jgi:hypothetical protein
MTRYKRFALKAAKELCYSAEVLERIRNAVTDNEVCRIMITARERRFNSRD